MKSGFILFFFLLASPLLADVKLPRNSEFFKDEKLVQSFKAEGGEVRMLSTAKDFNTLKAELKKFLGEGWQTAPAKEVGKIDAAKQKALGFSKDTFVIYVHPEDPKLKVTLALTKLPGKAEGESTAILTIIRNAQK